MRVHAASQRYEPHRYDSRPADPIIKTGVFWDRGGGLDGPLKLTIIHMSDCASIIIHIGIIMQLGGLGTMICPIMICLGG